MDNFKSASLRTQSVSAVGSLSRKSLPHDTVQKTDGSPVVDDQQEERSKQPSKQSTKTFKHSGLRVAHPYASRASYDNLTMNWLLRSAMPSKLLLSLPVNQQKTRQQSAPSSGLSAFRQHQPIVSTVFRHSPSTVKLSDHTLLPEAQSVADDASHRFNQLGVPTDHQHYMLCLDHAFFNKKTDRNALIVRRVSDAQVFTINHPTAPLQLPPEGSDSYLNEVVRDSEKPFEASGRLASKASNMRNNHSCQNRLQRQIYGQKNLNKKGWVIRPGASIMVPAGAHLVKGNKEAVLAKAPYDLNRLTACYHGEGDKQFISPSYLAGLGAMSCWSWLNNWIKNRFERETVKIFLISYQLNIIKPVDSDFYALSQIPSKAYMDRLFRKLRRFRRSRFEMEIELSLGRLKPVAHFKPLLAVILQRTRRLT